MAFDLVLFGGTGDLAWRKLLPALFQAHRHGMLPDGGRILAIGRTGYTDDDYRAWLRERFQDVEDAKRPGEDEFARFAALLHYLRVDLSQPADYERLRAWVSARDADAVVFYLATSPHLFPVVSRAARARGPERPERARRAREAARARPQSAQAINRVVRASFTESQALRIDHYVGKPAVQNLMALRFGNVLFEPLWRRESIASITIRIAESIGVGTRGDFYDQTGALRDMIQNHALQLLTMIAMEPPARLDADDIHAEKLKVLRALKPFDAASVARDVVRGQYDRLASTGLPTSRRCGPTARPRPTSRCAPRCRTGAGPACRSTLCTGKRLAEQERGDRRPVPRDAAQHLPGRDRAEQARHQAAARGRARAAPARGERHVVRRGPDAGVPRPRLRQGVRAQPRRRVRAAAARRDRGRLNLFVRSDEQEEAWRWVEPILRTWEHEDARGLRPLRYDAGSHGPG